MITSKQIKDIIENNDLQEQEIYEATDNIEDFEKAIREHRK